MRKAQGTESRFPLAGDSLVTTLLVDQIAIAGLTLETTRFWSFELRCDLFAGIGQVRPTPNRVWAFALMVFMSLSVGAILGIVDVERIEVLRIIGDIVWSLFANGHDFCHTRQPVAVICRGWWCKYRR